MDRICYTGSDPRWKALFSIEAPSAEFPPFEESSERQMQRPPTVAQRPIAAFPRRQRIATITDVLDAHPTIETYGRDGEADAAPLPREAKLGALDQTVAAMAFQAVKMVNDLRGNNLEEEQLRALEMNVKTLTAVETNLVNWQQAAAAIHLMLIDCSARIGLPRKDGNRDSTWKFLSQLQLLALFADARCRGNVVNGDALKVYGKGLCSTTYADNSRGSVFKPMPRIHDYNNSVQGMEAAANLVSRDMNELFAKHGAPRLLVEAEAAVVVGGPEGTVTGISMAMAPGKTLNRYGQEDSMWRDGEFRRQETWLQLEDCIMGAIDRHVLNVLWDSKKKALTAIDHDLSFQQQGAYTIPRELFDGKEFKPPCTHYCMPPAIDEEMATFLENLHETDLRAALNGKLLAVQVDAASSRLNVLKDALRDRKFLIVKKEKWGNDAALRGMTNAKNSYFRYHRRESDALAGAHQQRRPHGKVVKKIS
jgi:hypothetical protein